MKRKVKDAIIKTVTAIMVMIFVFASGCLDTPETNVPIILCFVSEAYLALFLIANRKRLWREYYM